MNEFYDGISLTDYVLILLLSSITFKQQVMMYQNSSNELYQLIFDKIETQLIDSFSRFVVRFKINLLGVYKSNELILNENKP